MSYLRAEGFLLIGFLRKTRFKLTTVFILCHVFYLKAFIQTSEKQSIQYCEVVQLQMINDIILSAL